jgi:hydrogenase maturation factor
VHPFIKTNDPDVILGSVFGEDVALTRIHSGLLVSHIDPIVGAVKDIGWLAVHVACNDIATSGTSPRWVLLLVLVPDKGDEQILEEIMRDAGRAADEIGVSIIGGHTGYSSNLSRPLVAVTAMGTMSNQKPILTKGAQVGDHIIITKGIALEGTAILANDFSNIAKQMGLSDQELTEGRGLMKGISIIPEALLLSQRGATSMHDVTRGGLLETLLEVAKLSNVGMKVYTDRIPILPVVSHFSKAFQFDPLKMISSGTLVATIPTEHLAATKQSLDDKGIVFADIGQIVEGIGVQIIQNGQITLYQEIHCEEDELARMWVNFPRDST